LEAHHHRYAGQTEELRISGGHGTGEDVVAKEVVAMRVESAERDHVLPVVFDDALEKTGMRVCGCPLYWRVERLEARQYVPLLLEEGAHDAEVLGHHLLLRGGGRLRGRRHGLYGWRWLERGRCCRRCRQALNRYLA